MFRSPGNLIIMCVSDGVGDIMDTEKSYGNYGLRRISKYMRVCLLDQLCVVCKTEYSQ